MKRGSQGLKNGLLKPVAAFLPKLQQTEEEIRDKLAGLVVKEGESRGDKVEKPSKDGSTVPVVKEEKAESYTEKVEKFAY